MTISAGVYKTAAALGEGTEFRFVVGMEYLVVLYAKQALDLRAIMRGFVNAEGSASERLAAAVGVLILAIDHQ
jgi:hypothetical protein